MGATKKLGHKHFYVFLLLALSSFNPLPLYNVTCFSLIIALKVSNEVHRSIKHPYRRIQAQHNTNLRFSIVCLSLLLVSVLLSWIINLILFSGDVHPHPEPDFVSSLSDTSTSSSISTIGALCHHMSIMYMNIHSTLPKLDLIKCESLAYVVLVFTESRLKPEIKNDDLLIDNFLSPFRVDRCNRPGDEDIIYVRDTLTCKCRTDLELQNLEAIWIEIVVKTKNILTGGLYPAPNSNADYFTLLNESIDSAHNTNIPDIVVTGDFNFNMHSTNNNKMKDLIQNYNLKQLIKEDAHFTENSSSLLDLILVRNSSNILTSGVADSFIADQIRFRCPILVILEFLHASTKPFKRRVLNYERANFDIFRTQ